MPYNQFDNPFRPTTMGYAGADSAALDAGLRAYMLRVYNWMASGLVLTGLVALGISQTSLINLFYTQVQTPAGIGYAATPLAWIAIIAPLGFVMILSFGINRLSTQAAQALFWGYCATMGASLTTIFLVYTQSSIAEVFFITAGTFAATSLYGYTTRANLTGIGGFFMMGLFGIIIASVVNMFLHSSALQFGISILGVLIFVGLTAYDTQRIKTSYLQLGASYGMDAANKRSVLDALQLYLNFINLFMFLLRLFGQRSSR